LQQGTSRAQASMSSSQQAYKRQKGREGVHWTICLQIPPRVPSSDAGRDVDATPSSHTTA
jgi:hypothetical protein